MTQRCVDSLVTLCATLHEFPFVRFRRREVLEGECRGALPEAIANGFDKAFSDWCRTNTDFMYHGMDPAVQRATLLILDRSEDPVAPFLHEFTYQAMVEDLLPVENGIFQYKAKGSGGSSQFKKVLLDENDELWVDCRHHHVAEVAEKLQKELHTFLKTNAAGKVDRAIAEGKATKLKDLNAAIADLPDYRERKAKYAQHTLMCSDCFDVVGDHDLLELADIEQTLVTGVDKDGSVLGKAKLSSMVTAAVKKLGAAYRDALVKLDDVKKEGSSVEPEDDGSKPPTDKREAAEWAAKRRIRKQARESYVFKLKAAEANARKFLEDKLRLMAIYCSSASPDGKERDALYEAGRVDHFEKALLANLTCLGAKVAAVELGSKKQRTSWWGSSANKKLVAQARELAEGCDYSVCRYVPKVKTTVEKHVKGELDLEKYPWKVEPPWLHGPAPSLARNRECLSLLSN